MPEWYVDAQRSKVNFASVLPALAPTVDIFRVVVDQRGLQLTYLWSRAGYVVRASDKADAIAAQSTDSVPAVPTGTPTGGAAATVEDMPTGATVTVVKSGSTWPARPTNRSDVIVRWRGAEPSPPIVSSGTGGMLDGVDERQIPAP